MVAISIFVSAVVAGITGWVIANLPEETKLVFDAEPTPTPTPLARYEIENLAKTEIPKGEIEIGEKILEEDGYTSYKFRHKFDPTFTRTEEKMVTGQVNLPAGDEKEYPLILMIRGYIDQELYETGIGTKPAAAYFSENGFITIAPDFLGYGGSSHESDNIYETRFQTYTTVLSILNSLEFIKEWNKKDLFIWAHSNGGQIALTTLAITGDEIPTTLWAPVTATFPYSILFYTNESPDEGKYIRSELSKFEDLYDASLFSFTNFPERINAPLQIHQGTADDAIPVEWTESFVAKMRAIEKEVEYFEYPGADHNLRPDWDRVVIRDIDFFKSFIQN